MNDYYSGNIWVDLLSPPPALKEASEKLLEKAEKVVDKERTQR